jgi:FkbM family methyltransferase
VVSSVEARPGSLGAARGLSPAQGFRTYLRRALVWFRILTQVRGAKWRDQQRLLRSAAAGLRTLHRDLDRWVDPVATEDFTALVPGVGSFHVRAGTDDLWHVLPSREPTVFRVIARALARGDTFVDAGANIGFYTVLAARRIGPEGKVFAVEMMPETAAILRNHLALNRLTNVVVIEQALSRVSGEVVKASIRSEAVGQASIVVDQTGGGGSTLEVRTTTLDEVLREVPAIRLMKMDIEGAEPLALAGGAASLKKMSAVVFEHRLQESGDEIESLMRAAGLTLRKLDGANTLAER